MFRYQPANQNRNDVMTYCLVDTREGSIFEYCWLKEGLRDLAMHTLNAGKKLPDSLLNEALAYLPDPNPMNPANYKEACAQRAYLEQKERSSAAVPTGLGRTTGSLVNYIMSGRSALCPEVGMGATELWWSDRHAYTIVEVSGDKKRIVVQRDIAKRIDRNGFSESQTYEFTPDPTATRVVVTLRKNGRWVVRGTRHTTFAIGFRQEYYDYSF